MNYTNGANTYSNSDLQLSLGHGESLSLRRTLFSPQLGRNHQLPVNKGPGVPDVDSYTLNLTGQAGHSLDIVLAGQQGVRFSGESLQLLGTDGTTVLATGVPNPVASGTRSPITTWGSSTSSCPLTAFTRSGSPRRLTQGTYAIIVTDSLLFDSEPSSLLTDPLQTLTVGRPALGYVDSADANCYSLLTAGQQIVATTATPFDNPSGLPGNLLIPELELYDPSGTLVATNQGGAADGRNALLTYAASAAGTYTIEVSGRVPARRVCRRPGKSLEPHRAHRRHGRRPHGDGNRRHPVAPGGSADGEPGFQRSFPGDGSRHRDHRRRPDFRRRAHHDRRGQRAGWARGGDHLGGGRELWEWFRRDHRAWQRDGHFER